MNIPKHNFIAGMVDDADNPHIAPAANYAVIKQSINKPCGNDRGITPLTPVTVRPSCAELHQMNGIQSRSRCPDKYIQGQCRWRPEMAFDHNPAVPALYCPVVIINNRPRYCFADEITTLHTEPAPSIISTATPSQTILAVPASTLIFPVYRITPRLDVVGFRRVEDDLFRVLVQSPLNCCRIRISIACASYKAGHFRRNVVQTANVTLRRRLQPAQSSHQPLTQTQAIPLSDYRYR